MGLGRAGDGRETCAVRRRRITRVEARPDRGGGAPAGLSCSHLAEDVEQLLLAAHSEHNIVEEGGGNSAENVGLANDWERLLAKVHLARMFGKEHGRLASDEMSALLARMIKQMGLEA